MAYDYTTAKTFTVKPAAGFPDFPDVGVSKVQFLTNEPVVLQWTKYTDYYGAELGADVQISPTAAFSALTWNGVKLTGGTKSIGALAAGTYYIRTRWNPDSITAAFNIPVTPGV